MEQDNKRLPNYRKITPEDLERLKAEEKFVPLHNSHLDDADIMRIMRDGSPICEAWTALRIGMAKIKADGERGSLIQVKRAEFQTVLDVARAIGVGIAVTEDEP